MMLLSRFRALFVRAEDVSAACLLLVYPTSLLATAGIYPVWERYGIRFQILCNSALLAIAIIICSQTALSRFVVWFRHSLFVYLLPIWLIGLSVMGWRHGFGFSSAHHQGLISGFLGALCVPFICYVMYAVRSFWIFNVLGLLVVAINVMECFFLGLYSYYGVSQNATFTLWGEELPRVFLNTRDGGAWSVFMVGYVFVLWHYVFRENFYGGISLRRLLPYILVLLPSYLLSLMTSSRGVFVSIAFAFLTVRLFGLMRRNAWIGFFLVNVISILVAFFLRMIMGESVVQASRAGVRLVEVDQTRLQLWFSWLKSISMHPHDWLLGNGFNYFPSDILPPGYWPANVHNLYIQILVDSGLLGVVIVLVSLIFSLSVLIPMVHKNIYLSACVCFALSAFFVYSATSAILAWPSGCWLAFLVLSGSLGLATNSGIITDHSLSTSLEEGFKAKSIWFLKLIAVLLFFGFLCLQIPLVAARYTYLLPDILTGSSL